MGKITRLNWPALSRRLGIHGGEDLPEEFSGQVIGVLDLTPFLEPELATTDPSPALTAPRGLQAPIKIGTGVVNAAIGITTGMFEVFGGVLVGGADQATKVFSHATAPNREYEIWGAHWFGGQGRGSTFEMNGILTKTRAFPVAFANDEVLDAAEDLHALNGWNKNRSYQILPVPYVLAPNQGLFFSYTINNLGAAAAVAEINLRILWKYAGMA